MKKLTALGAAAQASYTVGDCAQSCEQSVISSEELAIDCGDVCRRAADTETCEDFEEPVRNSGCGEITDLYGP